MSFLENLEWRYATKAFDTGKKVSPDELKKILAAVRMAPTSFGLQPFHVDVVTDQATKDKIAAVGWNQAQYKTASHILIFRALTDVNKRVNELIELMSGGNAEVRARFKAFEDMLHGFTIKMTEEVAKEWAAKQAYIALGFAMAACAELKVDSCPMEGFSPTDVDKVMNYPKGQYSICMLPIGFREANVQLRPKVRFSEKDLITQK